MIQHLRRFLLITLVSAGPLAGIQAQSSGLYRYPHIAIGTGSAHIVAEDSNDVWIHGSAFFLARYQSGGWQTFSAQTFGLEDTVRIVDMIKYKGNLWLATNQGIVVINHRGQTPILQTRYTISNGLSANQVNSLDANGEIFTAATSNGLSVFDGINWTVYNAANAGFATNVIREVRSDANNIAAVTEQGISVKPHAQSWRHYSLQQLGLTGAANLHAAPFGTGGLVVSAPGKVFYIVGNDIQEKSNDLYYNTAVSATDVTVYGGEIYVTSGTGIMKFTGKRDHFNVPADYQSTRISFDGMGNIYFRAVSGFYRIDSAVFYANDRNAAGVRTLDIGNYRMLFTSRGDLFMDKEKGTAVAQYPKVPEGQTGKHVSFAAALWIGGKNGQQNLHISGQHYRQSTGLGQNYWPGVLKPDGTADPDNMRRFDRIWKLNRFELETFRRRHQLGQLNSADYAVPEDILTWPGNHPYGGVLAPYEDVNQDGMYNALDGDYPVMKGDQMLWWVVNDAHPVGRGISNEPLRVEIAATAYGFTCPAISADSLVLNTSFLINYKITNKSTHNYSNTAFGIFHDTDLGNAGDDFVGSHVGLNTVYTYNGDDTDEGPDGYGNNPPAFGMTVIEGPLADIADGLDNNRNGQVDEVDETIGLTNFLCHNSDNTVLGEALQGIHAYNHLTGKWKDNTQMVYGGNGYPGSAGATALPTQMMFTGSSDLSTGYALGGTPQHPVSTPFAWSEAFPGTATLPNVPADRRYVAGMGQFTFPAGATRELTLAFIISQATQPGAAASVARLFEDVPKVQHWYRSNHFPSCLDLSTVAVEKTDKSPAYKIYPNPATDRVYVKAGNRETHSLTMLNLQGSEVITSLMQDGLAELDVQHLPAGIYFLRIQDGMRSEVHKVILTR